MLEIKRFGFEEKEFFQAASAIRTEVFVRGQNVPPELEHDEFEKTSHHYLAFKNNIPVGTARWRETEKGIKLERFAVLKEYRKYGIGSFVLQEVLKDVIKLTKPVYLHAQITVVKFYEKYGFKKTGNIFTEAGIKHYKMLYV